MCSIFWLNNALNLALPPERFFDTRPGKNYNILQEYEDKYIKCSALEREG